MFDMGDYSTRFVTQLDINLPARQQDVWVGLGISANNHFATIVQGNSSVVEGILSTELLAIANDGSVQVTALNGAVSYDRNVKVDVYAIR